MQRYQGISKKPAPRQRTNKRERQELGSDGILPVVALAGRGSRGSSPAINEGDNYSKKPKITATTTRVAPVHRELARDEAEIVDGGPTFEERVRKDQKLVSRIDDILSLYKSTNLRPFIAALGKEIAVLRAPQEYPVAALRDSCSVLSYISCKIPTVCRDRALFLSIVKCLDPRSETVSEGPRRALFAALLAARVLWRAFEDLDSWPDVFAIAYAQDAMSRRLWVDHEAVRPFVYNILTFSQPEVTSDSSTDFIVRHRYPNVEFRKQLQTNILDMIRRPTGAMEQRADENLRSALKLLVHLTSIPEARKLAVVHLQNWAAMPPQEGSRYVKDVNDVMERLGDDTRDNTADDRTVLTTMLSIRRQKPHRPFRSTGSSSLNTPNKEDPVIRVLRNNPEYEIIALRYSIWQELWASQTNIANSTRAPVSGGSKGLLFDVAHSVQKPIGLHVGLTFREFLADKRGRVNFLSGMRKVFKTCAQANSGFTLFSAVNGILCPPFKSDAVAAVDNCEWLYSLCLATVGLITAADGGLRAGSSADSIANERRACQIYAVKWISEHLLSYWDADTPVDQSFIHKLLNVLLLCDVSGLPPEIDRAVVGEVIAQTGVSEEVIAYILTLPEKTRNGDSDRVALIDTLLMRARHAYFSLDKQSGLTATKAFPSTTLDFVERMFKLCGSNPKILPCEPKYTILKMVFIPLCSKELFWNVVALLTVMAAYSPTSFGKVLWKSFPVVRTVIEHVIKKQPYQINSEFDREAESFESENQRFDEIPHAPGGFMCNLPKKGARNPPDYFVNRLNQWEAMVKLRSLLVSSRDPDFFAILAGESSNSCQWMVAPLIENPSMLELLSGSVLSKLVRTNDKEIEPVQGIVTARLLAYFSSESLKDRENVLTIVQQFLSDFDLKDPNARSFSREVFGRLVTSALKLRDNPEFKYSWMQEIVHLAGVSSTLSVVQDMLKDAMIKAMPLETDGEALAAYVLSLGELQRNMDLSESESWEIGLAVCSTVTDRPIFVKFIWPKVGKDVLNIVHDTCSSARPFEEEKEKFDLLKSAAVATLSLLWPEIPTIQEKELEKAETLIEYLSHGNPSSSLRKQILTCGWSKLMKLTNATYVKVNASVFWSHIYNEIHLPEDCLELLAKRIIEGTWPENTRLVNFIEAACQTSSTTVYHTLKKRLSTFQNKSRFFEVLVAKLEYVVITESDGESHDLVLISSDGGSHSDMSVESRGFDKEILEHVDRRNTEQPCTIQQFSSLFLAEVPDLESHFVEMKDVHVNVQHSISILSTDANEPDAVSVNTLSIWIQKTFPIENPLWQHFAFESKLNSIRSQSLLYLIQHAPWATLMSICRWLMVRNKQKCFHDPSDVLDFVSATMRRHRGWDEVTRAPTQLRNSEIDDGSTRRTVLPFPPKDLSVIFGIAVDEAEGLSGAFLLNKIRLRIPLVCEAALMSEANLRELTESVTSFRNRGSAADLYIVALYDALPRVFRTPLVQMGMNERSIQEVNEKYDRLPLKSPVDVELSRTILHLLDENRAQASFVALLRLAHLHPSILLGHIGCFVALLRGAGRLSVNEFAHMFQQGWPRVYGHVLAVLNALRPSVLHLDAVLDIAEIFLARFVSMLEDTERDLSGLANGMADFLVHFMSEGPDEARSVIEPFHKVFFDLSEFYPSLPSLTMISSMISDPSIKPPLSPPIPIQEPVGVSEVLDDGKTDSFELWEPLDNSTGDIQASAMVTDEPGIMNIPLMLEWLNSHDGQQRITARESLREAVQYFPSLIDAVMQELSKCLRCKMENVRVDALNWVHEVLCLGGGDHWRTLMMTLVSLGREGLPALKNYALLAYADQ